MPRRVSVAEWGLLLAGILLSLVLGEILVRVFRLAPEVNQLEITKPYGQFVISENPILKYVPKAHSRGIAIVPLFEDYDTYRWLADHRAIARLAEQHGLVALDLLPAFRDGSGNDFRKLQGRCNREHPDEAGHRLIAEELGKLIGARFLTRESPKP